VEAIGEDSVPCEKSGMENQTRICVWSFSEGGTSSNDAVFSVLNEALDAGWECWCRQEWVRMMDWSGVAVVVYWRVKTSVVGLLYVSLKGEVVVGWWVGI
jgi:hypothetical protein